MARIMVALWILLATLSAAPVHARAQKSVSNNPQITVIVDQHQRWIARYRFDRPVTRMTFDRSPDASRTTTWTAMNGFRITRNGDDAEFVSRIDGKSFRQFEVSIPPLYRYLPKDYAPFSPFGDGSTLFHTGRMFACPERCPTSDPGAWKMQLIVRDGRGILLNGKRYTGSAMWPDGESGRYIYIGNRRLTDTGVVNAVIDQALPAIVRQQLEQQLPIFMAYFASRLGPLDFRPALFASYDAAHVGNWGRQGGTLPGQIFTHFYGGRWPQEFAKPDFANDLAWHFAHEAGHLHQRGIFTNDPSGWWIHEGGAEAFAAIALQQSGPDGAAYVERRIKAARQSCAKLLNGKSLHQTTRQQSIDPAYQCGLLVNLAIDSALRRQNPESDGLYIVWRAYLARNNVTKVTREEDFLVVLAAVGGAALRDRLAGLLDTANPDFSTL